MSKLDIKLLALDMDGTTCMYGGEIIKENIPAIQDALKAGVEVVVVTGRPVDAPQNKMKENGFGNYGHGLIAGYNGACIYDFMNNKVVDKKPVKPELAKKIFELAERPEFKDVEVWGYVDDLKTVIDNQEPSHRTEVFRIESQFFTGKYKLYKDVKDDFNYSFFKLLAWNVSEAFAKEVEKLDIEIATSNGLNTEINAKGVNKAFAVKWLADHSGLNVDQVMAIGDGANDIPMIKYAGYGTSLENSIPAVKEAAKIHMPYTNEQGGVAEAIYEYVLGRRKN